MRGEALKANSAPPKAVSDLEQEVARVASLNKDELRELWRKTKGQGPPDILSKDLIARLLTQALQEARLGGMPSNLRKQLAAFTNGRSKNARYMKTGSIIVREYQGQLHEVMVVLEGFLWRGQAYRSLSTIARKITGTTWNGPRFFGLRGKGERDGSKATKQKRTDNQQASSEAQATKIVRRRTGNAPPETQKSKDAGKEGIHWEVGI